MSDHERELTAELIDHLDAVHRAAHRLALGADDDRAEALRSVAWLSRSFRDLLVNDADDRTRTLLRSPVRD